MRNWSGELGFSVLKYREVLTLYQHEMKRAKELKLEKETFGLVMRRVILTKIVKLYIRLPAEAVEASNKPRGIPAMKSFTVI